MFSRDVGHVVLGCLAEQSHRYLVDWDVDGHENVAVAYVKLAYHCMYDSIYEIEDMAEIFPIDLSQCDNTALIYASMNNCPGLIMRVLEDPRVDPTARNNFAIRRAVWFDNVATVEYLMKLPRVDPVDDEWYEEYDLWWQLPSAMQIAATMDRTDLLQMMITDENARASACVCCRRGCPDGLRWALEKLKTSQISVGEMILILNTAVPMTLNHGVCFNVLVEMRYDDVVKVINRTRGLNGCITRSLLRVNVWMQWVQKTRLCGRNQKDE